MKSQGQQAVSSIHQLPDETLGDILILSLRRNNDLVRLAQYALVSTGFRRVVDKVCLPRCRVVDLSIFIERYGRCDLPLPPRLVDSILRRCGRPLELIDASCRSLRDLSLIQTINALNACPVTLNLSRCQVSDDVAEDLQRLQECRRLILHGPIQNNTISFPRRLPHLLPETLRSLSLDWTNCDDDAVQVLTTRLRFLEDLSLRGNDLITNKTAHYICAPDSELRRILKGLDMTFCNVDDVGIRLLASGASSLEHLTLTGKSGNIWGTGLWTARTLEDIRRVYGHRLRISIKDV
eukprot:Plantae.Rhodophyta-Rhodochaete_pulchella.ctg3617.p1 GENE.Plantae.Rhodophyta-Rhodochaete_pulchella.ctg3617~~Plantae.Rhodophyta-Rhodochaete_pulchella.ctg3617.p1  ORF type:complete len:294 (-),score=19.57 Plantae.Rhodophyta-Rhodochaete_pulchella.ctg3617:1048-1929(-)